MALNPPFEYSISPERIEVGTHWMSIHLKNVSRQPLMNLDVRLISNDPYRIRPLDRSGYVNMLNPGEERVVSFQVEANQGGWVYLHVEYWLDEKLFYWESPNVWTKVRRDPARILTLFSIKGPQVNCGELVPAEATIIVDKPSENLRLDFWVETAGGRFESFESINLEPIGAGEVRKIQTQFTPDEEGLYSIYAYLFDGDHRLDRKIEQLRIVKR